MMNTEMLDIEPLPVRRKPTHFIARYDERKHYRSADVRYKTIGGDRDLYTAPRRCPHTSWVEELYGPEYTNPAKLYLRQREALRKRPTRNKIVPDGITLVILCTLAAIMIFK
jgi:hypothetical protein